MKIYSKKEIQKHNNVNDCWIIAHNYVYNVTDFINKHPGEGKMILKKAGLDCTIDYNFHSSKQKKIWKKYLIGRIQSNIVCKIT